MALTKISRGLLNTGVSDSSDATAITIDSSEKVGLNGLSAGDYWSSSNQLVLGNTASGANGGLTIATADNAVGQIYFADGTSGDAQYRGQIQYTHVSDAMDFQTAAGFRMRIDSSGNVGIGTASPQSNLQVATANGTLSHFGGIATTNTHYTGISLGYSETANANYRKTAIVQEQLADGAARGTLHFLVDTAADANSAALADSKMSIHGVSGDVSIANILKFNSGFGSAGNAYGVRAWVNFDGTASSISPRGAGNVGSITDHGVGQYTCNFTNAMPDTNYVIFGSGGHTTESNQIVVSQNRGATAPATGSCRISVTYANSYLIDVGQVTVAFIR